MMGGHVIVLMIHAYRRFLRDRLRRECLFRVTCSECVKRAAERDGAMAAFGAFMQRLRTCRGGYSIVLHDGERCILSSRGEVSPYPQLSRAVQAEMDAVFAGLDERMRNLS